MGISLLMSVCLEAAAAAAQLNGETKISARFFLSYFLFLSMSLILLSFSVFRFAERE